MIFWIIGILVFVLGILWSRELGLLRGLLATLLRIGWLIPILACFFPAHKNISLPRTLQSKPVHLLIDDSESMNLGNPSRIKQALSLEQSLEKYCKKLGCVLKKTRLSKESELVQKGLTPLHRVIPHWLEGIESIPWILMSDGGDSEPQLPWSSDLKRSQNGLIISLAPEESKNLWLEKIDVPPFAFETKPSESQLLVKRSADMKSFPSTIQVQVLSSDLVIATANGEFAKDQDELWVNVALPALTKGQHLFTLKVLPAPDEKSLWDNEQTTTIEVMPNTLGVLHLLGNPSWDGRFLRRYLKSEPKYDLISFFILRDPNDSQLVNEREMSLIPFPVARLFNEELNNFRLVIIQDFTLLQFLMPQYQQNLVEFVKNGGGLLFIGGHRALSSQDLMLSPLKEILPFTAPIPQNAYRSALDLGRGDDRFMDDGDDEPVDRSGPWYDPNLNFQVHFSKPDLTRRALANFYDEWEDLKEPLTAFQNALGIHHMENVTFKGELTPLLFGKTPTGAEIPLAVASYPNKGRAIWIFSDTFWRLALASHPKIPRNVYSKFMEASMSWLMREDFRKPLLISQFQLFPSEHYVDYQMTLEGVASRYLEAGDNWSITICNLQLKPRDISMTRLGDEKWKLSGRLHASLAPGLSCEVKIQGESAAFGSLQVQTLTRLPKLLRDSDVQSSQLVLQRLADATKSTLLNFKNEDDILAALEKQLGGDFLEPPPKHKTVQDFYWLFDQWYLWLFLLCLPFEVLVRRKREILGH